MTNILKNIQIALAVVGGLISAFVGGWDGLIITLVIFIGLDYLLGVAIAVMKKELSSAIGYIGILKKVLIFVLVGVGHTLDLYVIGNGDVLRTTIILYYISNEGISILENCAVVGLPIPEKLKDILIQLREDKKKPVEGNNADSTKPTDE